MANYHLRRRSYAFWVLSRVYWALSTLFAVGVVACSATAAVLTTQPNVEQYQSTILALSISSAILTSIKNVTGFAENSASCRDISRSLDTLANDYAKGRVTDAQTEKRIMAIRRRVPLGTCLFLRVTTEG